MDNKIKSLKSGLKWSSIYALSLIASKILRGAIIPKILDPSAFGLFASAGLYTRYLQLADIGASAHFIKELPYCHFNKSEQEKQTLVNRTFSFIVLSFAVVVIYLSWAAISFHGDNAGFYEIALLLLIPISILGKLKEFMISYLLGTQNYKQSSLASIVNNYVPLIFVVLGVYLYGALGGIIGMLASEILVFIYVVTSVRLTVELVFDKQTFNHWRNYLKQFSVMLTELIAVTFDQIFLLMVFGPSAFGIYILGLTFAWIFEAISEIFNNASYPKIMAIARDSRSEALRLLNHTLLYYLLACLLVLPAAIYLIEALVTYYFSQYAGGLTAYAVILYLGVSRGALALIRRAYIALNKEKRYIAITVLVTAMYAMGLSMYWLAGLSFTQVVGVIIATNFIALSIMYVGLVGCKAGLVLKNGLLNVLIVVILALYQYLFREQNFVFLQLDAGLMFLCSFMAMSLVIAYLHRNWILKYA